MVFVLCVAAESDFLEILAGISGIATNERPSLKTGALGPLQCPNLVAVGGLRLVVSTVC